MDKTIPASIRLRRPLRMDDHVGKLPRCRPGGLRSRQLPLPSRSPPPRSGKLVRVRSRRCGATALSREPHTEGKAWPKAVPSESCFGWAAICLQDFFVCPSPLPSSSTRAVTACKTRVSV